VVLISESLVTDRSRKSRWWLVAGTGVAFAAMLILWDPQGGAKRPDADPAERGAVPDQGPGTAGLSGTGWTPPVPEASGSTPGVGIVVARDVLSAAPIPELWLDAKSKSGEPLRTNESGEFEWRSDMPFPQSADALWRRVGTTPERDGRYSHLVAWFGRSLEIRGRVVAAPGTGEIAPVEMASMRVTIDTAVKPGGGVDDHVRRLQEISEGRTNVAVPRRGRLRKLSPRSFDVKTGEFVFDAAFVGDIGVRAIGRGWSCASIRIDERVVVDRTASYVRIEVPVHPRPRITGVVMDPDGNPSQKAIVKLYLESTRSAAETDPDRFAEYGFGTKYATGPGGVAGVTLTTSVETDSQGRFEIEGPGELDWPGTLTIKARPDAVPSRIPIASARDAKPIMIRWIRSSARVRVVFRGAPLRDVSLAVNDLTDRLHQYTYGGLPTDAAGDASAAWFELGREYGIHFDDPRDGTRVNRLIRWRGQSTLELDTLHSNLSEFDADPNR
jgi:hypothetical protein